MAGILVQLELIVAGDFQLMGDCADLEVIGDHLSGFEVLAGELKSVIPERVFAGAISCPFCQELTIMASRSPPPVLSYLAVLLARHIGVVEAVIGQDHGVLAIRVLEEVKDALLLHAAG